MVKVKVVNGATAVDHELNRDQSLIITLEAVCLALSIADNAAEYCLQVASNNHYITQAVRHPVLELETYVRVPPLRSPALESLSADTLIPACCYRQFFGSGSTIFTWANHTLGPHERKLYDPTWSHAEFEGQPQSRCCSRRGKSQRP